MFYSKTTGGFYDTAIHLDKIPADAVEIAPDEHAALLMGQASGLIIASDAGGRPVLVDPPLPLPPSRVTMRQARLALLANGLLDDVDTALSAIPDATQRRTAQIEWEYAQTVDRSSSWVTNLAEALKLSPTDLDDLFSTAANL